MAKFRTINSREFSNYLELEKSVSVWPAIEIRYDNELIAGIKRPLTPLHFELLSHGVSQCSDPEYPHYCTVYTTREECLQAFIHDLERASELHTREQGDLLAKFNRYITLVQDPKKEKTKYLNSARAFKNKQGVEKASFNIDAASRIRDIAMESINNPTIVFP